MSPGKTNGVELSDMRDVFKSHPMPEVRQVRMITLRSECLPIDLKDGKVVGVML